jgi:hypothetical protein
MSNTDTAPIGLSENQTVLVDQVVDLINAPANVPVDVSVNTPANVPVNAPLVNAPVNTNTSVNAPPTVTVPPTDLQITTKHIIKLVQSIKDVLNGHELTPVNIIRVAAFLVSTTASMKDLPERLEGVAIVNAFENFIDQENIPSIAKEAILVVLQGAVTEAVNVYHDIKNGDIKLSNSAKSCCIIV